MIVDTWQLNATCRVSLFVEPGALLKLKYLSGLSKSNCEPFGTSMNLTHPEEHRFLLNSYHC